MHISTDVTQHHKMVFFWHMKIVLTMTGPYTFTCTYNMLHCSRHPPHMSISGVITVNEKQGTQEKAKYSVLSIIQGNGGDRGVQE